MTAEFKAACICCDLSTALLRDVFPKAELG